MHTRSTARTARQSFLPLVATLGLLPLVMGRLAAQAGTGSVPLDQVVVTATRTPVSAGELGSSVDFYSGADLAREQIDTFGGALGAVAGLPVFASGAPGASASLFLRGANSNQTLFLVDGLRMNDPDTDYAVFLGGASLSPSDSVEIVRGPQSTLYGGEAVGGVVALRMQPGEGAPAASVGVEGGSFGTVRGTISAQGAQGGWAYNTWLSVGHTDNQRVNNAFAGTNYALRLDRRVNTQLALGATWRGFLSRYGSPGDRFTNDPDNRDREQNQLATLFADYTASPAWSGRVTFGGQDRRFVSVNPTPGQPTQVTVVRNQRAVLDWQNTWQAGAGQRLTAGLTAERSHTRNDGFGDIDHQQNLLAFFAQEEWTPTPNVFLTGGLRSDDHDTFGRATTGRVTAAWLPVPRRLKLRASYGTAFRSPSFLDLYGQSAYYVGNPRLQPEHARGWDGGADLYLADGRGTVSATWFENDYRDLIVYDFSVFPGTTANVDRARTRGLEFAWKERLAPGWEARLGCNYLEADDLTQQTRLLRRPRHTLTAGVERRAGRWSGGAGLVYVADRQDVDPVTFATIDAPDYTVVRVYAAWAATDRLTVKLRVENLLDRHYEEVAGYPALGAGVFAGIEARF